ncbi:MAG: TonB-dependent receptor [Ignavibacteria bacterium]|jgi:TonB-linked SusC/RagA family outer membrane protein
MKNTLTRFNIILVTLILLGGQALYAQPREIRGMVTSAVDGNSLPGASVVVKGTNIGTATDINGEYSLRIPEDADILVVSFVGYRTTEVLIGIVDVIDIELEPDAIGMDEVLIVGYGSQTKRDLTSSVSSVRADELEYLPTQGFDHSLQGKSTGLLVTGNSGTPGGAINVKIRGVTSIAGNNQPLWVVDGMPLYNLSTTTQNDLGGQSTSILAMINPNDIESIQVLKDAASTAIYGSRASNGVILITTKSGQLGGGGGSQITFNFNRGIQDFTKELKVLNAHDYLMLRREAFQNDGIDALQNYESFTTLQQWYDYYGLEDPDNPDADTDWLDLITETGIVENYNMQATGGTAKTNFFLSGGYYRNSGVLKSQDFRRISARINVEHKLSDIFTIKGGLFGSNALTNRNNNDNNIFGLLTTAMNLDPTKPVYNNDGTYYAADALLGNAVAMTEEPVYELNEWKILPSFELEANVLKNLKLSGAYRADITINKENHYEPYTIKQGQPNGNGTQYNNTFQSHLLEALATSNFRLAKIHDVDFSLGTSYQYFSLESERLLASNFPSPYFQYIINAASIDDGISALSDHALLSFFGRANYKLLDKYLLGLSLRVDGSSRFGKDNRYGTFPAVSAGWILSEEKFIRDFGFFNNLKLRGSYGITGNQSGIGNFQSLGLFTSGSFTDPDEEWYANFNYADNPGYAPIQIANTELRWEETSSLDIGIDMFILNSRVNLSLDYYTKNTTKLLLDRPIPASSGFDEVTQNFGEMENKGFEIELSTINFNTDKFSWTTEFNITFNSNKVTKLVEPITSGFQRIEEGHEFREFYLIMADGIYQSESEIPQWKRALGIQPGDINFVDVNGDQIINSNDRQYLGSPHPDFFGGMTNNLTYKGFDLSFTWTFVVGNDIFNANRQFNQEMYGGSRWNKDEDALNRWTPNNPSTTVPRATWIDPAQNNRISSFFLEDGTYFRLRSLVFGYTLPQEISKSLNLNKIRFYFMGKNLITITDYTGPDPEVDGIFAYDFFTYPQMQSFSLGIDLGL